MVIVLLLTFLISCSSNARKVIDRADGNESTPEWTSIVSRFTESGGKVYVVGRAEFDSQSDTSACIKAAIHDGKVKLAQELSSRIKASSQVSLNKTGNNFSETSSNQVYVDLAGVSVDAEFWKRQLRPVTESTNEVKLLCFAKLSMSSKKFREILKSSETNSKGE